MRRKPVCPPGVELSQIQRDAVKLIASGCTARYTALVLNIKFPEVKRWMAQDERFKDAVAEQMKKAENAESLESARAKPARKNARAASTSKRSPS